MSTKSEEILNNNVLLFNQNLTIGQKILQIFYRSYGSIHLNNLKIELKDVPIVVFTIFLDLMETGKWKYQPEKSTRIEILSQKISESIEVDCYDLSRAFIKILLRLGINRADVFEKVYPYRLSKKCQMSYDGVYGKFECFDKNELKKIKNDDNCFFFDNHAVAVVIINKFKRYFDLTFKCYYEEENAIFDTSVRGEIFSAASANDFEKLRYLLASNTDFDINTTDNKGQTLLHWAAIHKNVEMAAFLIKQGINPNLSNNENQIPLQMLSNPDSDFFLLLENHSQIQTVKKHLETYNNSSKMLLGFSAIRNNDIELLKKLLRPGRVFDVNVKDENGWTLLHWAAYYNRLEMAEYLLSLNANANIPNDLNLCPIQLMDDPNLILFQLLASYTNPSITAQKISQCDIQQPNRLKMSKAIELMENGDSLSFIKLFNKGLNENEQDFEGFSLLHYAVIYKREKIVSFLLAKGANPNITNKYDLMPIQFVANKSSKLCLLLLKSMKENKIKEHFFINEQQLKQASDDDLPAAMKYKKMKRINFKKQFCP